MALGDPYVKADRLQAYLGVNDALDVIESEVAAAAGSAWVTQFCGRDFNDAGSVSARVFRPHSPSSVLVDDFHTITGLIVKDGDNYDATWSTTRTSTEYMTTPLNGVVNGRQVPFTGLELRNSQWAAGTVQVTARWGWASVPSDVELATLMVAARYFGRRHAPEGVAGGFQSFSAVDTEVTDPDVLGLLGPFRRLVVGVA